MSVIWAISIRGRPRPPRHWLAFDHLSAQDRRPQRAGIIMAAIYQTLLEEIRRDGCHVLAQRTSLTPVRKLWIAWRTWLTA